MESKEIEKENNKELISLIRDLKIYVPRECYYLYEGRIGKLMDRARDEKEEEVLENIDKLKLKKIKDFGISMAGKYRNQGMLEFAKELKLNHKKQR